MLPDAPSFRAASSRLVNHVSIHLWTNLFSSFSSEAALANQLIKIRQAPAGQSLYGGASQETKKENVPNKLNGFHTSLLQANPDFEPTTPSTTVAQTPA